MPQKRNAGLCHCMMFQGVTVAIMDCSVQRRVERGVREVAVTPLTVPVSVHQDGNRQRVTQVCLNLISHKGVVVAWSHPVYAIVQTICTPKSERIGCDRFFLKLLLCKNRLSRDQLLKVYTAKGCLFISIELKATIGSLISTQKSRS